jgi:hypothetical protein
MIAAAMTTTSATVIQQSYAGLPPPLTSEDVRLSLIAETSTAMRLKQRGRPDEKLVTGNSNGPAYATVYATPWTLAELSSNDVPKAPPRAVTQVQGGRYPVRASATGRHVVIRSPAFRGGDHGWEQEG